MAILGSYLFSINKHFLNLTKITVAHFSLLLLYNLNPVKDAALFGFSKTTNQGLPSDQKKGTQVIIVKKAAKKSSSPQSATNYHNLLFAHNYVNYAPPVLVSYYVIIESLTFLYQNGFHFSSLNLPRRFFSHRIMLQSIWPVGDAVVFMALFNAIFVFTSLFFDPMFSPKLVMYLFAGDKDVTKANKLPIIVQNGKVLNPKISLAITDFYRKTGGSLRITFTLIFIICQMYVTGCMYQNQSQADYRQTPYDTFMWLVVILSTGYMVAAALFLPFFFVISARYVQIKQKLMRTALAKLQAKVFALKRGAETSPNGSQFSKNFDELFANFWRQLAACNRESAALLEEIRLYNAFWAKYITSNFLLCIVEICYFAFIIFIISTRIPVYQTFVFSFVATLLLSLLLYVTLQCSQIVYRSGQLARAAQAVAMTLVSSSKQDSKPNLQASTGKFFPPNHYRFLSNLFKVDQMAANYKNIESVSAFRLSIGYEINSRMFQMLFTYTSLYFMMIVSGYYKKGSLGVTG